MKFTLKEHKKFILKEYFILEEKENTILVEAQATAKQLVIDLNKLDALVPELIKYLTKSAELNLSDELKDGCSNILQLITENTDFKDILENLRKKASSTNTEENFSEEMIKVLQPLCYNIASDINSIKDRLKSISNNRGSIDEQTTALKERIPSLKNNIEELFKLFKEIEVEEDVEYKYSLNNDIINLKKGNKFILKVSVTPEKEINPTFESSNTEIATVDENGTITAIKEGSTEINVKVEEKTLICKVTVLKDKTEEEHLNDTDDINDSDKPAENSADDLIPEFEDDWATEYAGATDKEAIIEAFIYEVWSDDVVKAEQVIKIKKAFQQECVSYGFSRQNPFISFISNVYLPYEISVEAYNVVHNLVATKTIPIEDLTPADNNIIGKANLIFCKELYKLEPGAIKLYLNKQKALIDSVKKLSTLPDTFKSKSELLYTILYKTPISYDADSTISSTDAALNTMSKIELLEQKYTGAVMTVNIESDNEDQQNALNSASIVTNLDSTEDAIKLLATITIKFNSNKELVSLIYKCKEVAKWMQNSTTWDAVLKDINNSNKLYKLDTLKADKAIEITNAIFNSKKFKLTIE